MRLVVGALEIPSRVREFRVARRRQQADDALLAALEAYFEGRYAKAEQAASESIELGEHTRLSAVLAARAAHELRAYDRRDAFLEKAAQGAPEDDALRIVTEAELLLEQRRAQEAADLLKALPRKHTAALRLELKALQQTRRWDQVLTLVDELERRRVFDAEQAAKLRTHAIAENLKRKALDPHALDEAWKKVDDAHKRDAAVAVAAAQSYIGLGRRTEAQEIIEESLEANWDSELVALYADCAGGNTGATDRARGILAHEPHGRCRVAADAGPAVRAAGPMGQGAELSRSEHFGRADLRRPSRARAPARKAR